MTVGKKKRFEVFKRDGFTCQYCGRKPPEVVLQCDHIEPRSNGGTDDQDNLITACFDCNSGKSNNDLEIAPSSIVVRTQLLREKREQMKEFERLTRDIRKRRQRDVDEVAEYIDETLTDLWDFSLSDEFRKNSLPAFMDKGLTVADLMDCFDLSQKPKVTRGGPDALLKYFCGICWTKIRSKDF